MQKHLNKNNGHLINYVLIAAYLTVLLFLIRFAVVDKNVAYVFVGLLPITVFICVRHFNIRFKQIFFSANRHIIGFYACYYLIYFYNFGDFVNCVFLLSIIFFQIVISSLVVNKVNLMELKYLIGSLFLVTLFAVFLPTYSIVQSLKLGSFYNFSDKSLITTTTLDAPLIASLLFILAVYDMVFNKKRSFLNIVSLVFSCFVLLLFSRRGFIFSAGIAIGFCYLYKKLNKSWIIYTLLLFLFLPMFWNTIASVLLSFSDSKVFSSIIARNDSESISDATGRLTTWTNVLDIFFKFSSKHMLGIHGKIPDDLFIQIEGEKNTYSHAHNTFLNLFLEGGYVIDALFILLLITCFRTYNKARKLYKGEDNFYFIILIFLLNLAATESLIRNNVQLTNFIFCFTLVSFNLKNVILLENYKEFMRRLKSDKLAISVSK